MSIPGEENKVYKNGDENWIKYTHFSHHLSLLEKLDRTVSKQMGENEGNLVDAILRDVTDKGLETQWVCSKTEWRNFTHVEFWEFSLEMTLKKLQNMTIFDLNL